MNRAMSEPENWPTGHQYGDQVNAGLIAMIGLFAAVVLLLIVVLLQAWFYNWKEGLAAAQLVPVDDPQTPLGQMRIEQEEQIDSYHWVDRQKQVRAIPIGRAMALVAEELAAGPKDRKREMKDRKQEMKDGEDAR
jgi:hypothetical protein